MACRALTSISTCVYRIASVLLAQFFNAYSVAYNPDELASCTHRVQPLRKRLAMWHGFVT